MPRPVLRPAPTLPPRPRPARRRRPEAVAILLALAAATGLALDTRPAPAQSAPAGIQAPPGHAPEPARHMKLAARRLLLDGAAHGEATTLVGMRGHILNSTGPQDAAEADPPPAEPAATMAGTPSWRQADHVPVRSMLTAVAFLDARTGVAVGHDQAILRSEDGGRRWELIRFAPTTGSPMSFMALGRLGTGAGRHLLAVGTYGLAMRSDDGGRSWQRVTIAEPNEFGEIVHLYGVASADGRTVLIPAEFGEIYRSRDGGRSWEQLDTSPYDGTFFGAVALGPASFLLYGLEGRIFRTADAGESWTEIDSPVSVSLQAGAKLGDGRVVVAGPAGTVLVSHDNGRSFIDRSRADRMGIAAVVADSAEDAWLLTEQGPRRLQEGERADD